MLSVNATNGTISHPLSAGAHTLTKADSNNLYYINLYNDGTALQHADASSLSWDGQTLHNPEGLLVRLYTVTGACLGSTTSCAIGTEYLPEGWYIATTQNGALKFRK